MLQQQPSVHTCGRRCYPLTSPQSLDCGNGFLGSELHIAISYLHTSYRYCVCYNIETLKNDFLPAHDYIKLKCAACISKIVLLFHTKSLM